MEEFVSIARVVRTRGIRGELVAEVLTDFPERFEQTNRVRIVVGETEFWESLEASWFQKGRVVLKFQGLNRPHEAEYLIGGLVQVPEAERVKAPEGTFFHSDLIGCLLLDDDQVVGHVAWVLETGAADNLVIETVDGRECLVPFVEPFILEVDLQSRRIRTRLPAGLLETAIDLKRTRETRRR